MKAAPSRQALLALVAALGLASGCQAYVAKKRDELKQHFIELAGDDEACRSAVETGFERCWDWGMATPGDDAMARAIITCLNETAKAECFSVGN